MTKVIGGNSCKMDIDLSGPEIVFICKMGRVVPVENLLKEPSIDLCCAKCCRISKTKAVEFYRSWNDISRQIKHFVAATTPAKRNNHGNDIISRHIGKLFILSAKKGGGYWCRCDCGRIIHRRTASLKKGNILCCPKCVTPNLVGRKFNRLTVVKRLPDRFEHKGAKRKRAWYKCKCDCGNFCETWGKSLLAGHPKSCGCYERDRIARVTKRNSAHRIAKDKTKIRLTHWAVSIKNKAKRICGICGSKDRLEAHHLWSKDTIFGDLRSNSSMGVCLCHNCHFDFHNEYGFGGNTPMQFKQYRDSKILPAKLKTA